ncbi:MAG: GGDEF domain-containing protein [Pseudomonadota bacterium]
MHPSSTSRPDWGTTLAAGWARWAPPAGALLVLLASLVLALYAAHGLPKPPSDWKLLDIAGEGGSALMAAVWCVLVRGARPRGRVTRLLAGGLGLIALGGWADCLDEFIRLPAEAWWDNALEGLMPIGMAVLTAGLLGWRREQQRLSEHLRQRERLFRDHRGFDRVTELADAGYLRQLLRLEQREHPGQPCALVMLEAGQLSRCLRLHGPAESDRLLQALCHLLLLNLRPADLLCRCAGDRFAVLLPGLEADAARRVAEQLQASVAGLNFHTRSGEPVAPRRPRVASVATHPGADPLEAALAQLLRHPEGGGAP